MSETNASLLLLERRVQRLQRLLVVAGVSMTALILTAFRQDTTVLTARQLVLKDARGKTRIVLGPLPDFGGQRPGFYGMAVFDSLGYERYGLSLRPDGAMVLGLDAPHGKGDDRNSERINLTADEEGGAEIRMLDKTTKVKSRMLLLDNNDVVVDFLDWGAKDIRFRRLTARGDTVFRESR